jgi:hypothetical protein
MESTAYEALHGGLQLHTIRGRRTNLWLIAEKAGFEM